MTKTQHTPKTIADLLFWHDDPEIRAGLEAARQARPQSETDLTRRYTSTWPQPEQEALKAVDFDAWIDGLPSFVYDYLWEQYVAWKRAERAALLDEDGGTEPDDVVRPEVLCDRFTAYWDGVPIAPRMFELDAA